MAEPMSDARLSEIDCRMGAGGGYTGAPTKQDLRRGLIELVDEVRRLRIVLGAPETVWGHQVHGDDGWIGEAVPQGSEATARAAVDHMNTRTLGPESGCRAKLIVHEVWHAETEWRVVRDGQ